MRRTTVILSAAVMLLAVVPASALARHHHRRDHSQIRHARIERFGRDVTGPATSTTSADNAGTVQSFSNGVLTIMLNDGSTVSGMVTDETELECTAPEQSQAIHADGDSGSGEQSGSGGDQAQGSSDQSSGDDQADAAGSNETQAQDQNDNQAGQDENQNEVENENEMENNCSTADLTGGAVVREAELRISSPGGVWKKVELGS